ncbi:MAG: hypothetical protein GY749_37615 [Desulfobacteraceae bacterium]|nr:hypothetical protein [Desulfobacteraceae bacterium]
MTKRGIASLIEENKTVFIIIAIGLFLIELEIFAVAAIKSGRDKIIQVFDKNETLVYEVPGNNLSEFNKYYFEKTFGPLDQYNIKLLVRDKPFPFRAWFVAALGIPIGIILLFAFVVKAYMSLFYGDEDKQGDGSRDETRLGKLVDSVSRFNIFTIGFFMFLLVISYWVIPEVVIYLGKLGEETILKYRWFFLSVIVVIFGVFTWIIYLRYLLARRTIDSQAEVDKYRMQLEFNHDGNIPVQLEYKPEQAGTTPLVGWDKERVSDKDDLKGKKKKRK